MIVIDEAVKSISIVKLTRQQKAKMAVSSAALKLAKQANDPLYRQYERHYKKMIALKRRILRKYGPKAMRLVRSQYGTAQKTW